MELLNFENWSNPSLDNSTTGIAIVCSKCSFATCFKLFSAALARVIAHYKCAHAWS